MLFHAGQNCGCDKCAVVRARIAALDALVAEVDRLIAERQRLTDENDKAVRALWDEKNKFMEALEAEQRDKGFALAEVERLGVLLSETEGERVGWKDRAEAAEAEVQRLREALQALGDATRLLDVMLREPAAKCLMTAEDYRVYVNGAWLGVDEANVKARAALREDA